MSQATRTVRADELNPGMVIEEVTELSFDYASLDEKSLKFLKNAFKGAKAVLVGGDGVKTVAVEELKLYDSLQSILSISPSSKIATVVEGMGAAMEKYGLLEFKVSQSGKSAPAVHTAPKTDGEAIPIGSQAAKKRFEVKKEEVKKFLASMEKAVSSREQSNLTVEEMLDNGRQGKFSSKGVEKMVEEILDEGATPAMKAIAGLRGSDQTYAHCTDMSVILQECYVDILGRGGRNPSPANRRFALIAGFMHDIGKSEVPKDILESTDRFSPDSQEMILMRNHTTYGSRILSDMGMPNVTINVAHYHHVKTETTLLTSYPKVSYAELLPLTRLASITDVYQALIGKRRYKKSWVPGKAIEYLIQLEGSEFDARVLKQFIDAMGRYPLGSLVRLSTNTLAFVMEMAPIEHAGRPIVAVVENADGELLTNHTLLDLMVEADLTITEVVDHYQHYSKTEDQAFNIFKSIRVA